MNQLTESPETNNNVSKTDTDESTLTAEIVRLQHQVYELELAVRWASLREY